MSKSTIATSFKSSPQLTTSLFVSWTFSCTLSSSHFILLRNLDSPMQELISVWVRDPRIQKDDFWHAYLDYEICIHTNSLAFNKKSSCVRRRYSEFVWLRQKLQENALLVVNLPELPPKNPFFSLNNARQITARMEGLRHFLEEILRNPVLLSDSCLHLFLQSQLSVRNIEACAEGKSHYTVTEAIQNSQTQRFGSEEKTHDDRENDSE